MEEKDRRLWILARKRVQFRRSLSMYLIISAFLWAIWWFMSGMHGRNMRWPWPVWPMLGWGLGLIFQYLDAYKNDNESLAEKEYEKLKRRSGS
jgi:hypothetical protein